jgi:hypothetical protein
MIADFRLPTADFRFIGRRSAIVPIAGCLLSTVNCRLSTVNCHYSASFRKRSALLITDTELKVMAAAAIIGLNSNPNAG